MSTVASAHPQQMHDVSRGMLLLAAGVVLAAAFATWVLRNDVASTVDQTPAVQHGCAPPPDPLAITEFAERLGLDEAKLQSLAPRLAYLLKGGSGGSMQLELECTATCRDSLRDMILWAMEAEGWIRTDVNDSWGEFRESRRGDVYQWLGYWSRGNGETVDCSIAFEGAADTEADVFFIWFPAGTRKN